MIYEKGRRKHWQTKAINVRSEGNTDAIISFIGFCRISFGELIFRPAEDQVQDNGRCFGKNNIDASLL